ncbi:MAG: DUF1364 family protein [Nitrosomonas sp.]|nr:DUF1364 family protein [Nitrosomonas sp.]
MSKITDSAKGMECQVRIIGVCNGNTETVVWAHANGLVAGKGLGMKSPDIMGSYACQKCHDHYDRRVFVLEEHYASIKLDFYEGHLRSLAILIEKELVKF